MMNMNRAKITGIFIALLLLCQTACGEISEPVETVSGDTTLMTEDSAKESTTYYFDTKQANYNGAEFTIWNYDNEHDNGWSGIPDDICAVENNGDILNDSVYKRNQKISESLGVTLIFEKKVVSDFENQLQSIIMAGDSGVDLVFPRQASFPAMVQKELLSNLNSIPTFDFSDPWWNQSSIDSLTLQGQLYGVISDATYYDKLGTYVTFYNKKLADEYKLGNLYDLVKNDEWTLDKLLDLGKVLSADLNSDGKRDDKDAYPLSCQNDACYILLHAARIPIASKSQDGSVVFNLTSEKAIGTLQIIYELMGDDTQFFNRQKYTDYTLNDAIAMFSEGRAMFMIRPIQSLFVMRNMDADFGILPLPKVAENQEQYGSAINPYVSTFAGIPVSVEDYERSANVLSLMACESYYSVIPALYETVLGNKLIRDEDSAVMLDITFESSIYDTGLLWNFGDITYKLLANTSTDVASMLASVSSQVDTAIDKLNEQLAKQK